jgi:PAS domain S-box-containing protein
VHLPGDIFNRIRNANIRAGPVSISVRRLIMAVSVAALYVVTGKLGFVVAIPPGNVTAIFPPAGIALAAILLLGSWVWTGVWLGSFLTNVWFFSGLANAFSVGPLVASASIATGSTLQALLGAFLIHKFVGFRGAFDRSHDTIKFVGIEALSCTVASTIGVSSLVLCGFSQWAAYGYTWWTWWLGDTTGAIVIAPLFLTWSKWARFNLESRRIIEIALLLMLLLATSMVAFGAQPTGRLVYFPDAYAVIPLLIWAAFRFGQKGVTLSIFLVSIIAIWGTVGGRGPLAGKTINESLLSLQAFVVVLAITGLVLAAATAERNRAVEKFRLVVESAPSAMVMVDRQGKISLVNVQAERLFGYKREELVGKPIEMLVPSRLRGDHREHREGFFSQAQTRPMGAGRDLYAVRKDGSEFPVEIGLNPIDTEHGVAVLSAIVDITDRKRAEQALRGTQAELELQVEQRTQDLSMAVESLQVEITERKRAENVVGHLSRRLLRSHDEERQRIARELHDSTGQKVAALAIDLAVVGGEAASLPLRARKALSDCFTLSDEIVREVRSLSYLLHPPMLDEVGLASAVRWYASGVAQRSGIQMNVSVPRKFGRLSRETETALFRIVQESLTNVVLHSGSKNAKIRITQHSQDVKLEVSDEGRGIPLGVLDRIDGNKRLGVGIVGMRERMKELGGRLEINSNSTGTTVTAIVPLEVSRESDADISCG